MILISRDNPWGRFRAGLGLLVLVIAGGTFGYTRLGLSVSEAVYQTVITISTVGYTEIGEVTGGYRAFTVILILFGAGTALYTIGVLIESIFEGRLNDQMRRRHMQKRINRLRGHVVLCGYGRVGQAFRASMERANQTVVVVEHTDTPELHKSLHVLGNATQDDVLRAAGVERASTLVVALDDDTEALYVSLAARTLSPELFIVARSNRPESEPKLRQVGVNRVVNPHELSGSRMAALVLRPNVEEFLNHMMYDGEPSVHLEEHHIGNRSDLAGKPLGSCEPFRSDGCVVVAVRRAGTYVISPQNKFVLAVGDTLILLGSASKLAFVVSQLRLAR